MDAFLRQFREQEQKLTVERREKTQCPYCSMQCTMYLHKKHSPYSSRYQVSPNREDPVVQGRLCVKGMQAHVHALDRNRLKSPLLRRNGKLEPVSWEEAMDWFRRKVTDTQRQAGRDAVAVYGGGSLTNEEAYLLGKFARIGLGTCYIDYNGRFCMSSAATAANQAFGVDRGMTAPLSDIPRAGCIIVAGANIAECQPTMMPYLRRAKANGAVLIVIDPRKTPTAKLADIHLAVRPGGDVALVNGILKVIVEEGYTDEAFLRNHTTGGEALMDYLQSVSIGEAARESGVPAEEIIRTARAYGEAETGWVLTARGVEQHATGVQNVRNFINLILLTGKIGGVGSGYGAVTGQGNGQGGREHGQKADQLPGYRRIDEPEHRRAVAEVWGVKESDLPGSGVSAFEMFSLALERAIRGMVILSSNPLVSSPDVGFVEKALKQLDFLVVIDLFLSETAEMADLVLPGSSYLEDEGTMTNLEGRVTLRRAVKKLPGTAKPDWVILGEMARVLGKGKYFSYSSPEKIFDELRCASRGGIADYSGISYGRIEEEGGVFWPCSRKDTPGEARLFTDRRFFHSDGRARLTPVPHVSLPEPTNDEYPLVLTTGRLMPHYLSGAQTRRTPDLNGKAPEPFLYMHPDRAKRCGLENGQEAHIVSRRGEMVLRVKLTSGIREDTVFGPMHWGGEQCINRLTLPELDPDSRMPSFKACAVRVTPVKVKGIPKISSMQGERSG
ncbi:nitrite reductase [Paludifilum halophilum]|uniref:Nitrite reductase n=1 Tax=Paludifilum halophilum TaxID=1642702 RepID=A0A235B448_9BACL|nr:molybdopterin oxidoreductase family protein [Paludifilum halophilum]OYD07080.1 nitrite reductase [Paludifilum halophilum]